jgi:predicted permease
LSDLVGLFSNNLLPVFLIAGSAYALRRLTCMDPRPISQVVFYLLSPCLLFDLLTTNPLNGAEITQVILFALVSTLSIGALTFGLGAALRTPRPVLAGVLLSSMFMNAGNFGLSVVYFAFGETALSYASLYFVTVSILTYSLGAVIASMGTASFAQSMANLLRVPMLYGVLLAVVFMISGWHVPTPLGRAAELLGSAAIPGMLILLGLQLSDANWKAHLTSMTLANGMRLLAGPLLAIALAPVFGLVGPARQALILEAAMPIAVSNTMLATEYNVEPSFVSAAVFISTVLSPLTLTPLLAYLGA